MARTPETRTQDTNPETKTCQECNGTGKKNGQDCPVCHGSGCIIYWDKRSTT